MKKDTLNTIPVEKISKKIFDLVKDNEDENVQALHKLCKNAHHVTFMGRVGQGLIAPIQARVKFIRVYRDEFDVDFVHLGNIAKDLGLNYHFFQNNLNEWKPNVDDPAEYTTTDILVLQYLEPEDTLNAIDLYKHYSSKHLVIYNANSISKKIDERLKGEFETSYVNTKHKGFHIYNKL
jgi:hypothetical protein